MLRSVQNITAKKLFRMYQENEIAFDLNVQRGLVWDIKRQSLFIDSLIDDYPVPMFFVVKQNNVLHFLDGQQRTSTIFEYMMDNFALHPVISCQDYTDKKFSELPKRVQEDIEGYSLFICEISPKNNNELEEVFIRLNNGVTLTSFELTRSKAGKEVVDFLIELTRSPLFTILPLSPIKKRRHFDEEMALNAIGLLTGDLIAINRGNVKAFVSKLRTEGISSKIKKTTHEICDYLYCLDFDNTTRDRVFKKSNFPIIFKLAHELKNKVSSEQFSTKISEFFINPTMEYRLSSISGSGSNRSISTKINELRKAVLNND